MDAPPEAISPPVEYPEVLQAYYLATFVPVNWGTQDQVSRSIVDFQFGREPETTQWVRQALGASTTLAPVNLIVRALSSVELTATTASPLDRLCSELASRLGCLYEPGRMTKRRSAQAVKNAGTREAREKILHGVFEFDATGIGETTTILVVDDIITTGATLAALTDAITEKAPGVNLRYFALARTDPALVRQHLGLKFPDESNGHRDATAAKSRPDNRPAETGVASPDRVSRPSANRRPSNLPDHTPRAGVATPVREFGEDDGSPPVAREPLAATTGSPKLVSQSRPSILPVLLSPSVVKPVVLGAIALTVLFVTFLLVQGPKARPRVTELPPLPDVYTPETSTSRKTAPPQQTSQLPATKGTTRPRGFINVPTVGLRTEPLITSPSVEGIFVQSGDRVTVVRTLKPEMGPEWFLIETTAGRRGWVIASVVTLGSRSPRKP